MTWVVLALWLAVLGGQAVDKHTLFGWSRENTAVLHECRGRVQVDYSGERCLEDNTQGGDRDGR